MYVHVYIYRRDGENVGTWGPPQSLERGGQTRARKQKRRWRGGRRNGERSR